MKKVPSNRENKTLTILMNPFRLVGPRSVTDLKQYILCRFHLFVCLWKMCQIVGCACCFEILRSPLYFCRRTFPRAFGGGISKAKFLFGHSLDVIDLMDRVGAASRPLQGFSLSRFSFSSAPSSESACNIVFHLPCRLQPVTA